MNANPAGFSGNKRWISARRLRLVRNESERPLKLSDLVERWVRRSYESDRIFREVERAFPPADPTPARRRGYREEIARLIVRYRHGIGRSGAT
jgi:hypothetical protein